VTAAELVRLQATPEPDPEGLQLINLRKLRSINSWMHNIDELTRSDAPRLLIHPDDAAGRAVTDGMTVTLSSRWGAIPVVAELTSDVRRGCVAYPHGWGHRGGWRGANSRPGGNLNAMTPDLAEQVSGMSWLEGFPVDVRPAEVAERPPH
jgi:formate dehydrogenase